MAYAALVSLSQTIDLLLNHNKYSISVDEEESITSLREYVIFLISFLEDFPEKVNRLEGKIRDLANEAEDIIEDLKWKVMRMRWRNSELFEQQLKRVTEEIVRIAGEMKDDRPVDLPAAISSSSLEPTSKNDDTVIGFDDDLIAIKDRLCGQSSERQVIPIVGMGGIGKTTLAKKIYHDSLVMEHFDIRAWVTVSQNYSAREIVSRILDSMNLFEERMSGQMDELIMGEKVYKSLKGRRYLIVMDDVWSTEAWDCLRTIFPDDNNGSRIMLTTRLQNVADHVKFDGSFHEMQLMDENQSWNLLKQNVFTSSEDCPPDLVDVGIEIAQSCRGLPLAVVLVAGILSSVIQTRALWEEIVRNAISVVDGQLEKILSLSYTNLPHHLRPCFLLLGGFPEDYEIRISGLIKLWVAEGFVKGQDRYRSLEEEAEEYLEDLVKRSLVLVNSRKINGKIKSCSLHDLVRDLCIRKAQEEKFLLHVMDGCVPQKNVRHLSLSNSRLDYLANFSGSTFHTILCFQLDDHLVSPDILENFRMLFELFELFHLRYLALGSVIKVPSAISNLENLQTFILEPGKVPNPILYLPLEIWRIPQLRHLVLPDFDELPNPPADGSTLPLEDLQTISVIRGLVCSEKILKMIPNVRKLGLIYDEDQGYHLHNLIYLKQLEKLKVSARGCFSWRVQNPAFPETLKKLTLDYAQLPRKHMAIIGSLPKGISNPFHHFAVYSAPFC